MITLVDLLSSFESVGVISAGIKGVMTKLTKATKITDVIDVFKMLASSLTIP